MQELCTAENAAPFFGVCFVDTSTAHFSLATFEDDVNRTKLETLLMQVQPRELITERVFQCIEWYFEPERPLTSFFISGSTKSKDNTSSEEYSCKSNLESAYA